MSFEFEPKLLSAEIASRNAEEFYEFICSLFQPRSSSGKSTEIQIKGKKIQSATKKRNGIYEIRLTTALGEKSAQFEFSRDGNYLGSSEDLKKLAEKICAAESKLREFFAKKKIRICDFSSCEVQDARLDADSSINLNSSVDGTL